MLPTLRPNSSRTARATVLVLLYTLIAMSPLAPITLHTSVIAHAVTGQCTGDCEIDGCAPERRANHTCCCWQKRIAAAIPVSETINDCCSEDPSPSTPDKMSCCPDDAQPDEQPCCTSDELPQSQRDVDDRSRPKTVYRCGCPCDNGTQLSLTCISKIDLVPYQFCGFFPTEQNDIHYGELPARLPSHTANPPTPPPEHHVAA